MVSWASAVSVEVDAAGSKIEAREGWEWTSAFSISCYRCSVPVTSISTLCDPHSADKPLAPVEDGRLGTIALRRLRGVSGSAGDA